MDERMKKRTPEIDDTTDPPVVSLSLRVAGTAPQLSGRAISCTDADEPPGSWTGRTSRMRPNSRLCRSWWAILGSNQ